MFSVEQVLEFHHQAIDLFGGSKGVRDFGSLDSALHRPWQTFGGEELAWLNANIAQNNN